jgi:hypothetical protein
MTKALIRSILILAPFALAPPRAASACVVSAGDFNNDGIQDILLKGDVGAGQLVTVTVEQTQTKVHFPCPGGLNNVVFSPPLGTLDIRFANVNYNITGTLVGFSQSLFTKAGVVTIGGTGSLTANSAILVDFRGSVGGQILNVNLPPVIDNSALRVRADLGDGNDTVTVNSTGLITNGASVEVKMNGGTGAQAGANGFIFNQSGILDGRLLVDYEGGPQIDAFKGTLAGTIGPNGRLMARAALLGGNDGFIQKVNLNNFTVAAGGEVRFRVSGGDGGDIITFTRDTTVVGNTAINNGEIDVALDGGPGSDKFTVDLGSGGFTNNGIFRLRTDGDSGNDTTTVSLDLSAVSTNPKLDIFLGGESATDITTLNLNNNGANAAANYGPAASAIVHGGSGPLDKCTVTGNGLVTKLGCEQ